MTDPVTANVWAEHGVWPQDPGFQTALEGGITTLQILPGSANLIGGRGVTLKNVPATTYQAMKFPGRAAGTEDGLRRESEARLRRTGPRADDAHGQRRRLSPGVRRCAGLPRAVATSTSASSRSTRRRAPRKRTRRIGGSRRAAGAAEARSEARNAGRCDGRRDPASTSTAIAPTRWRSCSTCRRSSASRSPRSTTRVEAYKIADLLARERRVRRRLGRLVGLQDGGVRRHPGEPRADRSARRRLRDRALGFRRRHSAPQSGSGARR